MIRTPRRQESRASRIGRFSALVLVVAGVAALSAHARFQQPPLPPAGFSHVDLGRGDSLAPLEVTPFTLSGRLTVSRKDDRNLGAIDQNLGFEPSAPDAPFVNPNNVVQPEAFSDATPDETSPRGTDRNLGASAADGTRYDDVSWGWLADSVRDLKSDRPETPAGSWATAMEFTPPTSAETPLLLNAWDDAEETDIFGRRTDGFMNFNADLAPAPAGQPAYDRSPLYKEQPISVPSGPAADPSRSGQ